jgi:hypothetical protein
MLLPGLSNEEIVKGINIYTFSLLTTNNNASLILHVSMIIKRTTKQKTGRLFPIVNPEKNQ